MRTATGAGAAEGPSHEQSPAGIFRRKRGSEEQERLGTELWEWKSP